MKILKILLAGFVLVSITALANAQRAEKLVRPEKPTKPELPDIKIDKEIFGSWLDDDGFIIPGPKIRNFIDQDRDRIDDRLQAGPGARPGKPRPEVEKPEKPETGGPDPKPILPTKPGEGGEKPVRPKPGEGGEKPGKPGEGGEKPGKPGKPKPPKPGKPGRGDGDSGEVAKPKPERPERPARPELSDDLKGKLESYKKENDELRDALKAEIKALKNPTRTKIREITKAFHEENKARFEGQKDLSKEIKEGLKDARPERPSKPEVPEAVLELRAAHDEILKSAADSKRSLVSALAKASIQERKALLDNFREEQKTLQDEMKNLQRQIRESIEKPKGGKDGGVRPNLRPPPRPKPGGKTDDRRPTDR